MGVGREIPLSQKVKRNWAQRTALKPRASVSQIALAHDIDAIDFDMAKSVSLYRPKPLIESRKEIPDWLATVHNRERFRCV